MNKELAKILTTALVQFIDRERPEETLCCSNAECESIEKMFEGDKFDIIEAFIQKKLSRLTEFELFLFNAVLDNSFVGAKGNENALEMTKKVAPELLALAKKELCNGCNANLEGCTKGYKEGYNKGYEVATRLYNESVAYHFPNPPAINIPTWTPPCYYGGLCTNPQMDCINCPRRTTGGGFNTSSGTSTAKAEG